MLDLWDLEPRGMFVRPGETQILDDSLGLLHKDAVYGKGAGRIWFGEFKVMLCGPLDMQRNASEGRLTQDVDGAFVGHMEEYEQIHGQQSEGRQGDLVLRFIVEWLKARNVSAWSLVGRVLAVPGT
jgi:hypothetical protein